MAAAGSPTGATDAGFLDGGPGSAGRGGKGGSVPRGAGSITLGFTSGLSGDTTVGGKSGKFCNGSFATGGGAVEPALMTGGFAGIVGGVPGVGA